MEHPNATLVKKIYADFSKGDLKAVLDACADEMKFEVPGKSFVSGSYNKDTFVGFATKLTTRSGGTLVMDVHDVLASDQHAVALLTDKLTLKGDKIELRTCHVWRFKDGKPVAWYEYPRDLHRFEAVWG